MRHAWFSPAVLSITAMVLAQGSAPFDNKLGHDSASASCVVSGRVVSAAEGNPLKSARVALRPDNPQPYNQIYATTSDSDGGFTLKDIPPGRYQFFALHTGFVEQQYKATASDNGPLFALKPGEKVSGVLFRLRAAAVITGRVSNDDGEPMQQVQVIAFRRFNDEEEDADELSPGQIRLDPVRETVSDDRGQYRIFALKPGEYYLRVADEFVPLSSNESADDSSDVREALGSGYGRGVLPRG
jgi:hypothetical protein